MLGFVWRGKSRRGGFWRDGAAGREENKGFPGKSGRERGKEGRWKREILLVRGASLGKGRGIGTTTGPF
jgi:hypothetical protein